MYDNKFWNKWPADFRWPYFVILFFALAALVTGVYHYLTGADAVFRWETFTDLRPVNAVLQRFQALLYPFELKVNGYLATQRYDVSGPHLNVPAAWLYIITLAVCLIFYLTVVSTLKRYVYMAGMVLFIFFLAGLNPDLLAIFNPAKKYVLITLIIIFGGLSYFFQAFQKQASFTRRLLIFTGAMAAVAAFLYFGSAFQADITTLYLANHSTAGGLVAAILFMLLVATDNLVSLVWINTQSDNPARRYGIWYFLAASVVYLLNLVLIYLDTHGIMQLHGLYIDAFIVLFLSAVSGFWVMRLKDPAFGRLLPFHPQGAYLYLVLTIITFISIGYAFATANDPLIAAFSQLIIYTHLAFGVMFLLYILINFGGLIRQKLRVYRVIFDPKHTPFYSVYITGVVLLLLIFHGNYFVYNQAMAGYYNYLGDLYKASGNDMLAIRYYTEGDVYENSNVKSNLSLAGIYRERLYRHFEIRHLVEALKRRPNEKIYARLGNMYPEKEQFFDRLEALQLGVKQYPESARLNNNLALVYMQTSLEDSINYYLTQAEKNTTDESIIQTNRLAFFIKSGLPKHAMQVAGQAKDRKNDALQSNVALLEFMLGQQPQNPNPALPDKNRLTQASFARLYHTTLQNRHNPDSAFIKKLNALAADSNNLPYASDLVLLKAFIQKANAQPHQAKETLENLATATGSEGAAYYYDILGQWMLENELPDMAAYYFNRAKNNLYADAFVHHSYALALAFRLPEAAAENEKIMVSDDPMKRLAARQLRTILNMTYEQALAAPDSQKLQFLMVHKKNVPEEQYRKMAGFVNDRQLRTQALAELAKWYLLHRKPAEALQTLEQARSLAPEKSAALSELNVLTGKALAATTNTGDLEKLVRNAYFSEGHLPHKNYYRAVVADNNNQLKEAANLYEQAFNQLVYQEVVILKAAAFYSQKQKNDLRAYEMLLDGITYNPYSAELQKGYVLASLALGFKDYARHGMERLSDLLPPAEYATFNQEFEARLNAPEVWD